MDNIDLSTLPKKERKRLKKELEIVQGEQKKKRERIVRWLIIVVIVAIAGVGVWWLIKETVKPLPGQAVADLGREHVSDGTKVQYNSNPPTSGSHYADWTRAGVYEQPISDGHLIHALEHGYVIVSYNCTKLFSIFHFPFSIALAHEEDLSSTSSALRSEPSGSKTGASPSADLAGDEWSSSKCQDLKKNLSDLANEKKLQKLIVIPRPSLDAAIALTAWTRIDKLSSFDKERIARFIDAFRDKGPEKTIE